MKAYIKGLWVSEDGFTTPDEAFRFAEDLRTRGEMEILDWAMQLCGSGMTVGMIRKLLHNKRVEITGEGEKA